MKKEVLRVILPMSGQSSRMKELANHLSKPFLLLSPDRPVSRLAVTLGSLIRVSGKYYESVQLVSVFDPEVTGMSVDVFESFMVEVEEELANRENLVDYSLQVVEYKEPDNGPTRSNIWTVLQGIDYSLSLDGDQYDHLIMASDILIEQDDEESLDRLMMARVLDGESQVSIGLPVSEDENLWKLIKGDGEYLNIVDSDGYFSSVVNRRSTDEELLSLDKIDRSLIYVESGIGMMSPEKVVDFKDTMQDKIYEYPYWEDYLSVSGGDDVKIVPGKFGPYYEIDHISEYVDQVLDMFSKSNIDDIVIRPESRISHIQKGTVMLPVLMVKSYESMDPYALNLVTMDVYYISSSRPSMEYPHLVWVE